MAADLTFAGLVWYWGAGLCCLGGGIAGFANNLMAAVPAITGQEKDSGAFWELGRGVLVGAIAGLIGAGTLRPADPIALLVTALLAGWLGDTYIARIAAQMVEKQAEESAGRLVAAVGGDGTPSNTVKPGVPATPVPQIDVRSPDEAESILRGLTGGSDVPAALATLDELIANTDSEEDRNALRTLRTKLQESQREEG